MSEKVVVAAVQMEPKFAAPEENLAAILNWAEEASKCGAQLVVFPECALTGYCFESREEDFPQGSLREISCAAVPSSIAGEISSVMFGRGNNFLALQPFNEGNCHP